ncbi:MAG: diphosphomevalonate decarboxylase, partial [Marinilabiliales bacterium]
ESSNSFPHSSGIASSASAMSALALCLTSLERVISASPSDDESFLRKASYVARLGSGSASRSVYPGFVLWGRTDAVGWSADEFAVHLNDSVHEEFREMGDAILIVDESPKPVSSSRGHAMMDNNPWSAVRYEQAARNTARLVDVLAAGDMDEFVTIVEQEAMTLHAMMMASADGYILMKPGTLDIIERVRRFREETGVPVAFTLDAGPNVHLIYPLRFRESVKKLVDEQLLDFCSGGRWIDDRNGEGPYRDFVNPVKR